MIRVTEIPNPVPQTGGPAVMFTLVDDVTHWTVSREGKPVSGFHAALFEDETSAQHVADALNAR